MSYPPGSFEFGDRVMDLKVQEARREVQGYRLEREARGLPERSGGLHSRVLAGLGAHLVSWGVRLLARYGARERELDAGTRRMMSA